MPKQRKNNKSKSKRGGDFSQQVSPFSPYDNNEEQEQQEQQFPTFSDDNEFQAEQAPAPVSQNSMAPVPPPNNNDLLKQTQDNFNSADKKITEHFQKGVDSAKSNIQSGLANVSKSAEPVTNSAKNAWNHVTNFFSNLTNSKGQTTGQSLGIQTTGGNRRKRGGGFRPSQDYGLAASGSPVYGIKTVRANAYIGGKKSKRKSKSKSKKSNKKNTKKASRKSKSAKK